MATAGMRGATPDVREWVRSVAEKAQRRMTSNGRVGRRSNREKDLFTLRARHVKALFAELEGLASAVNKELAEEPIKCQRALNPKNLGGIEVPDGARLALEFLERRVELVVQPLASVGGRPAPLGGLATASVIQYDRSNPSVSDWFDITLREDGAWLRKAADGTSGGPPFTDKEMRALVEWLVS
jgi:hypothetical protein